MSLFNVMSISSTGMEAENVRLNTTASNIANANSVSSSSVSYTHLTLPTSDLV